MIGIIHKVGVFKKKLHAENRKIISGRAGVFYIG